MARGSTKTIPHTDESTVEAMRAPRMAASTPIHAASVESKQPIPAGAPHGRRGPLHLGWLPSLILGALLLVLWQVLTQSGAVAAYLLPEPIEVARTFVHALTDGLLWSYTRTTLVESLAGFALGSAVALPVGFGIARSRLLARALEPYLAASQALPAIALAPLLILWLGYGLTPIAMLCALMVFFPMVVNTALGIRTLPPDPLDAARVDGAGWLALLWDIELPLALPSILAGMRTSLTLSITGAVVGEFVLGDRGLGGLLTIARGNFDTPLVFATLLMLVLLAAAMYGIARLAERWLSYLES